jgi:hypothetical protein
MYLMENALHADFAIVKAGKQSLWQSCFQENNENFSTSMAKAKYYGRIGKLVEPENWIGCIHVAGLCTSGFQRD